MRAKIEKLSEFDIYLPMRPSSAPRFTSREKEALKRRLTAEFGGVTDFRHRTEGVWRWGEVAIKDEILILRVLFRKNAANARKLRDISQYLRQRLRQKKLLIVEKAVQVFS